MRPTAAAKRGHIVQIVNCLGLGGTERQLLQSLRQLDLSGWHSSVMCLQKTGELLDGLRNLGIEPNEFHLRGSLLQFNTLRQIIEMSNDVRQSNGSLVHSHDFYSNLMAPTVARLAGVPSLVSRRDLGAWLGPWRRRALALATKQADHVLCNAKAIRDALIRNESISPDKITVVPNGIDISSFDDSAARTVDLPQMFHEDTWRIALVANMKHPLKGHKIFLKSAVHISKIIPSARFIFVGDGALRSDLELEARALGIHEKSIFLGRRSDVAAILVRCHALACSSTSEGLSNAIMEGMSARLPVVATAVGGNVELVRDGRTGFLVPTEQPDAMASKFVELAHSEFLARRMGNAGRKRIEDEFSADKLGRRMNELYSVLVKDRGSIRRAA